MRLETSDGTFGVVSEQDRDADRRFFRFQLVVGGTVIGDEESSILGSAIHFLQNVSTVGDERFAEPGSDPNLTLEAAFADQDVHDRVVFCHAESLDDWALVAYRHATSVNWLARHRGVLSESVLIATVPAKDYETVVQQVVDFWRGAQSKV